MGPGCDILLMCFISNLWPELEKRATQNVLRGLRVIQHMNKGQAHLSDIIKKMIKKYKIVNKNYLYVITLIKMQKMSQKTLMLLRYALAL